MSRVWGREETYRWPSDKPVGKPGDRRVNCTLRVRQENWGQLFTGKDCNWGVGCGARGRSAPSPHAAM
jgi:hypothetical protein